MPDSKNPAPSGEALELAREINTCDCPDGCLSCTEHALLIDAHVSKHQAPVPESEDLNAWLERFLCSLRGDEFGRLIGTDPFSAAHLLCVHHEAHMRTVLQAPVPERSGVTVAEVEQAHRVVAAPVPESIRAFVYWYAGHHCTVKEVEQRVSNLLADEVEKRDREWCEEFGIEPPNGEPVLLCASLRVMQTKLKEKWAADVERVAKEQRTQAVADEKEACAKAMCMWCEQGDELTTRDGHLWHKDPRGGSNKCQAAAIRAREKGETT